MPIEVNPDKIIWAYLGAVEALTDIVGTLPIRIYGGAVPEGAGYPSISYSSRGGPPPNPYITGIQKISYQFDCWAETALGASALQIALFNALQGVQNEEVVVDGTTYKILGARAETPPQELMTEDIPTIYRVLTFFEIMLKCE